MDNILISVIVPIYNVEDYLTRCLNSIINQTYHNLEIILVDDGSTDNSGLICDEYQKYDKRIKVIHQENGGLSFARNIGLDNALGDLISFVDGDDFIELTMLEELKKCMDITNSDISVCDFYNVYGSNKIRNTNNREEILILKNKDKFNALQSEYKSIYPSAWNKLYKKELFDNIRYPNGKIYEDSFIICDLLNKAKIVSYITKPLYNYVYRKDSISNNCSSNHLDQINSFNKRIKFYNIHNYYDLALSERNRKMSTIINRIIMLNLNGFKDKNIINTFYNELNITNQYIKWNDASKHVKRFKIFKKNYVRFRMIEYYFWNLYKDTIRKYTFFN